jgi:hypothetical protein
MIESRCQSSEGIPLSPAPVTCHLFSTLRVGLFRFTMVPLEPLAVPALNKGNMLRGGFGHAFRRLCCIPQCREAKNCPLANSCPYKSVFEPSPPPGADRLSKNPDIPRPFVFRAPQTQQTRFEPGERFEFGLVLIGRALDFLPYFVLSFRDLTREGLSLNRAKCVLEKVEELTPPSGGFEIRNGRALESQRARMANLESQIRDVDSRGFEIPNGPDFESEIWNLESPSLDLESQISNLQPALGRLSPNTSLVYSTEDQLFRATESCSADQWIKRRLLEIATVQGPEFVRPNGRPRQSRTPSPETRLISIRFLTPTFLRADGQVVRRPEFHHVFKRLRDRINALNTFFGNGPLDVDFRGLGERAEKVQMVRSKIEWVERFRTSSKTHQRHELSGFIGECTYELRANESHGSNLELLQWMLAGELVHVGKHTAWGNGCYTIGIGAGAGALRVE